MAAGRPTLPYTERIHGVTVSPEIARALDDLAALTGASRAAVVRVAVAEFLVGLDLLSADAIPTELTATTSAV